MPKRLTLIAGMHRSGTSLASRLLNLLGGNLGRNLLPAKPDNPSGFWENADIVQAHDDFLWESNRLWNNPVTRSVDFFSSDAAKRLEESLLAILEAQFEGDWLVIKDPRLCRLLPTWLHVARHLDLQPEVLLVARDPREVHASLERRDGLNPEEAGVLWARYWLEAEKDSRGVARAVMDYRQLLDDWTGTVRNTWRALGLASPQLSPEVATQVNNFLHGGMRHHKASELPVPGSRLWQELVMPMQHAIELAGPAGEGLERRFDALTPVAEAVESTYANVLQLWDRTILENTREMRRIQAVYEKQIERNHDELRSVRETYEEVIEELNANLEKIYQSRSWKITSPLRAFNGIVAKATFLARRDELRRQLRDMYYRVPLPWKIKRLIRRILVPLLSPGQFGAGRKSGVGPWSARYQRSKLIPPLDKPTLARYVSRKEPLPPLGSTSDPFVSVVIPVYGKLEYTVACLLSIAANRPRTPFEVIVVDDGSLDATESVVSRWPGVRYLKNPENLGFIGACNRGADAACGKYICFLNNDTNVLDGWLDELVETARSDEHIGLVGSKLVYPNGRLQEAGGIVWRDGSAWNYGRMQDPDAPEFSYRRDVDYVSGASILVPSDLFRELGGFDTHYKPAYYEDTDFAFKVRSKGLRVVMQPESSIIHYEGISSGTDLNAGIKRYQQVNEGRFKERWTERLSSHRPNGEQAELEKERDVEKRLLMIDATLPFPDQDAGSVIADHFISIFQRLGYKVTFVPENLEYDFKYVSRLQKRGVECIYYPHEGSTQEFIQRRGGEFDLFFVARPYVASGVLECLRKANPAAPLIYNTCDLHFLREQRQAEIEQNPLLKERAERTRKQELAVISAADCTIVVSPVEKELLSKELPDARVEVVQLIQEEQPPGPGPEERSGMVFIGGFQHHPNGDAVHWFVENVMPRLREQGLNEKLYVVGSKPPNDILALAAEDIEVLGFVEDITPIFHQVRCMVVPLRFGAGVKGKIGTAFAYGLPVISTDVGVEGMGLEDGGEYLRANNPQDWASTVKKLHDDALWISMSEAGRNIVRNRYSALSVSAKMEALLQDPKVNQKRGSDSD